MSDARVDNNEEPCPATEKSHAALLDELATLDPPQCREVAEELRGVAETFAEVPDDGRYGPYPPDARPLARPELTRVDPVLVTEFAEIADKLWHRPPRWRRSDPDYSVRKTAGGWG